MAVDENSNNRALLDHAIGNLRADRSELTHSLSDSLDSLDHLKEMQSLSSSMPNLFACFDDTEDSTISIFSAERVQYMLERQTQPDQELEDRSALTRSLPDTLPSTTREEIAHMMQFYIDRLREMNDVTAAEGGSATRIAEAEEIEWRFVLIEKTLGVWLPLNAQRTLLQLPPITELTMVAIDV
jgi:hypothetical protein